MKRTFVATTLLLLVAGCSTSGREAAVPPPSSTGGAPTASTTDPSPATSASAPSVSSPTPSYRLTTATGDLVSFRTPTGKIGCSMSRTDARCDLMDRQWTPPPRPADCDGDYGNGVFVDGSETGLTCATDTVFDAEAPVLEYGEGWVLDSFRCLSARTGVTCESTRSGRGFTLSRFGYRFF